MYLGLLDMDASGYVEQLRCFLRAYEGGIRYSIRAHRCDIDA